MRLLEGKVEGRMIIQHVCLPPFLLRFVACGAKVNISTVHLYVIVDGLAIEERLVMPSFIVPSM